MQNTESAKGSNEGPDADEIVEQGSLITADEVHRHIRRGDETKGDADSRDTAGGPDINETPEGRRESKNDKPGAANVNG